MWWSQRGHKWRHNMSHTNCTLVKQGYTHAHVHALAPGHTRAHTHKYVILIAFPRQQWLRERALMLRYTYTTCLVKYEVQTSVTTQYWHY